MQEYKNSYVVKIENSEQYVAVKEYILSRFGEQSASIIDRVHGPASIRISPGAMNSNSKVGYILGETNYYTVGESVGADSGKVEAILTFKEWQEMVNPEKGEITGYKLKKDTPMNTAGTIFSPDDIINEECFSRKQMEGNTKWFEPVYAPNFVTVRLQIGFEVPAYVFVDITPDGFLIASENLNVSIKFVRDLFNTMTGNLMEQPTIGGYPIVFNSFNIGCRRNITSDHLDTLIREWEKVNKQKTQSR